MSEILSQQYSKNLDLSWVEELVTAEQKAEETGIVDLGPNFDQQRILIHETVEMMMKLKTGFFDATQVFNDLKSSPLGKVKLYGIAQTHADFMLFRNGYKMIFSIKSPGVISLRMNFIGASFIPTQGSDSTSAMTQVMDESLIEATRGPFGEVAWVYKKQGFNLSYLVRHFLCFFIKESGAN
jgi:hypothetical protein